PWRFAPVAGAMIQMNDELPAGYELTNPAFGSPAFALSPDGARIAASLRGPDHRIQIQTRLLKESTWKPLVGSEGGFFLFFSPDGAWIGFIADNKMKKVPVVGGIPVELATQSTNGFRGASWGGDGYIFFSRVNEGLARVSASGGSIEPLG